MKPQPPSAENKEPWTQHELDLLHEMVRDYDRAQWAKGYLKWLIMWLLGLPAFALTVWEPLARLWKWLHSG